MLPLEVIGVLVMAKDAADVVSPTLVTVPFVMFCQVGGTPTPLLFNACPDVCEPLLLAYTAAPAG